LDVAVASRHEIVVATDSRRSSSDGAVSDVAKKLFLLEDNRVVSIAGLVDARHGHPVDYDQPIASAGSVVLPAHGTWHMGVVFTPEYPFAAQRGGAVFTDCEVSGNQSPLLLGENLFFGNRFTNAIFRYDGGRVTFGLNNRTGQCELRIARVAGESPCSSIRHQFARVVVE
jgi:hypothetical protein